MTAFGNLARFYDAVYADKDYAAEAAYVLKLLDAHAPTCQHLLELGSGTGRHAIELARAGRQVSGIDASADMVAIANERIAAADAGRLSFRTADATSFRDGGRYDAVIACFHVLNYMATPRALADVFATAAAHLPANGLFLFDSWHGPAVRSSGPETRVRDLRIGTSEIAFLEWNGLQLRVAGAIARSSGDRRRRPALRRSRTVRPGPGYDRG